MRAEGLDSYRPIPEGSAQYSIDFMRRLSVLKLAESDTEVVVGCLDPESFPDRERLERFHGKNLRVVKVDPSEFSAFLAMALSGPPPKDIGVDDVGERLTLDRLANDAPIVNLVNGLLIDGVRLKASDIHIEAFADKARVRYRIDGSLRTVATIAVDRFPAVSSRIKIMANLNIMERRLPQDGRVTVKVRDRDVDMRVSIVPIAKGESIVLRIFGTERDEPLSLEELGFGDDGVATVRAFYKIQHGLILATGPTGSGKTTTLNAMLREIRADDLKIITIEDPVEYLVDGVAQIQTNEQIHLGFDTILRRVLRQDPNVIMVGEIRDSQTAELAVRAALTGHLVLSTLHTNDSVSTISRLRNMGVEPYLIASVLRGAIAQRLVKRLCPECRAERALRSSEQSLFRRYGSAAKSLFEATGCESCSGTGYSGRIAVAELFNMDEELEERVAAGEKAVKLREILAHRGMRTLAADGLDKIARGLTTLSEVEREVGL